MRMNSQVLIVAAGRGTRLGCTQPKALLPLAGRPMLLYAVEPFLGLAADRPIVVVAPSDAEDSFRETLAGAFPDQAFLIVHGGAERQDSVRAGIASLDEDTELVIIHDAARPFVETETVELAVSAALEHGAATVAVPSVDTILEATGTDCVASVPDRSKLWACQTPQVFHVDRLLEAHQKAREDGMSATDDTALLINCGYSVKIVRGRPSNRKVTTADDVTWAEIFAAQRQSPCASD